MKYICYVIGFGGLLLTSVTVIGNAFSENPTNISNNGLATLITIYAVCLAAIIAGGVLEILEDLEEYSLKCSSDQEMAHKASD